MILVIVSGYVGDVLGMFRDDFGMLLRYFRGGRGGSLL